MAVSYVWPVSLPQNAETRYSESGGALLLRTPMDAGPAKLRRRGQRPDVLTLSFIMSPEQVQAFEVFVLQTLRGVARFGLPHPRLQTQVEARLVPSDGELYTIEYLGPQHWRVGFTVEVLP